MKTSNKHLTKPSSKNLLKSAQGVVFILALLVVLFVADIYMANAAEDGDDHSPQQTAHTDEPGDEHGDEHQDEPAKGPNNGRLLSDGDFTLELAIFERGVPPEYRAWATLDGKPIAPEAWKLEVKLTRLGGKVDSFTFAPQDGFLLGKGVVEEPHSFDVSVTATYKNKKHHWAYPSYEGRLQLSSAMAQELGLTTAVANPGKLQQHIKAYGQIAINPESVRALSARFPGIVRQVNVRVGSMVRAGDVLATVEANESLRSYSITAPIDGTVIARHANPGEATADKPLFTVANSGQLTANLALFPADAPKVQLGQAVMLNSPQGAFQGQVDQLFPSSGDTSVVMAWVPLVTPPATWIPGQWVSAAITVDEFEVPLRVDNEALQSFRDWQVVFIQVGDTYEIRPLELGRSDGVFTEVLAGLNPGDTYVVNNSYLLKADLEKSGASHDH